jgi:hypothetical protein
MVGLLLLGMLKSETILKVVEGVSDAIKQNQTEWAVVVVIDFCLLFSLVSDFCCKVHGFYDSLLGWNNRVSERGACENNYVFVCRPNDKYWGFVMAADLPL